MKTRIYLLGMVFGIIVAVGGYAAPGDLPSTMAQLDKSYIPALGLSGQADQQAKAKVAFVIFESEWSRFKSRFAASDGFDAAWAGDLESVSDAIAKAREELFENSDGPAAHEALEAVRMTLLESRTRQGIPYFIDSLTLFHNAMEDLLNDRPSKALGAWDTAERTRMAAYLDMAIQRWARVKEAESLIAYAALSPNAEATYRTQWQTIDSILSGAKNSLATGDEKTFSEALERLKPNFIKTFFLFGEFPRSS